MTRRTEVLLAAITSPVIQQTQMDTHTYAIVIMEYSTRQMLTASRGQAGASQRCRWHAAIHVGLYSAECYVEAEADANESWMML